jgi:Secretion system C-terminal sorting domain
MFRRTVITAMLMALFSRVSAQNTVTVQPGALIKTTAGGIITLENMDLDNHGTINQLPGDGTFIFSGSTNNSITGSSNPTFNILEIAKTGLTRVSLMQHISVGNSIHFTSGLIDLNNSNIFLRPNARLISERETSRITGITGGFVQIIATLNAPLAINPGNLGASISSLQDLGSVTIRRGHQSQINGDGNGNSIYRYYDIAPANNTALNATLRIDYFDGELNNIAENTLVQWKSADNTSWVPQAFSTRDIIANYVETTGIQDFQRWTLSSLLNALPVRFILFNTNCNNHLATLTWKTAQEQNSSHFEVQRSVDGISFTAIATIAAAGNSNVEKTYSYTDNNASLSWVYYRVAETAIDGRKQYTVTQQIQCGVFTDELKLWPNPVQQSLFVNTAAANASQMAIKIFDNKGALVKTQNAGLLRGNNQLTLDMRQLIPGTYTISLTWNNGQSHKVQTIVKQ